MDIQDYISSGIIENHVLGLTSPAEDAELTRMSEQYPEIRQALREAEEALVSYGVLHSKTPPASVKGKILQALADDGQIHPEDENQTSSRPSKNVFMRAVAIAASVLFLATVGFHLIRTADFRRQISQLKQEKADLIAQNEIFMAQIQETRQELKVIGDPAFTTVVLNGVAGYDNSRALVYWNAASHAVYLKPIDLPALPQNKQYQLWGIVGGQPVNAGIYDPPVGDQALLQMVSIENAEMFAITVEPTGGSDQPTLDQMVVAGKL
ncbi:anti-sigma factor [Parapedobacter indicus]|uniref:Anti-sigma-K factor rskA n=1 Tax=Parapedobacter indicus TaxID=1477437 RepID=A0A1I3SJS6_9SPHI|nr:anti-sigma factor [Parapedobacter indicus]PPK99792.1 anti-sigma-K factor rskA [Parapedobacter indicus]SFJ58660.1 Anti-sigma-K factor rskA [Parapedobacter indicus]